MPRRLFDNFGNYLFLFFVLQVQFAIKGSNAIPGNAQQPGQKSGAIISAVVSREQRLQVSGNGNSVVNEEDYKNVKFDSVDLMDEVKESQTEEVKESQTEEVKESQKEVELVVPKVVNAKLFSINTGNDMESSDNPGSPDGLEYSMLRSSFPLRPKTFSRQSAGNNSGDQTPSVDDWVDINSVFSGSSRIAKMIYSTSALVDDRELQPISFNVLCSFLEETAEKEMCEDELLLLCKRIIKDSETLVKALKDLPLFIQNYSYNENAIKINSILYSYLGHSGDCFKEIIESENIENGSGSSRCSSRGSDSTIATQTSSLNVSAINSPLRPPTSRTPSAASGPATTSPKSADNEAAAAKDAEADPDGYEDNVAALRVLDEINEAQAHVPHILQPLYTTNHLVFATQFSSLNRMGFRAMNNPQTRTLLYPLREETNNQERVRDASEIEEID